MKVRELKRCTTSGAHPRPGEQSLILMFMSLSKSSDPDVQTFVPNGFFMGGGDAHRLAVTFPYYSSARYTRSFRQKTTIDVFLVDQSIVFLYGVVLSWGTGLLLNKEVIRHYSKQIQVIGGMVWRSPSPASDRLLPLHGYVTNEVHDPPPQSRCSTSGKPWVQYSAGYPTSTTNDLSPIFASGLGLHRPIRKSPTT